ncbi:Holliday junction branch migration protein RuvA [Mycoplasma todarodis]|uniref:Holliday junction branch migration protein RuvA n=1 Tax=Mycoplasma todarodis TaxID=1937191 RepID=UPI003B2BAF0D
MLYKIGKIVSIGKNYIILESNSKGEIVYVPRPNDFTPEKTLKVFMYEYKYDNISSLYGFKTFKERILFEDLLTVPGIGPKTGIQILKEKIKIILGFLLSGDAESLAHLPGLGLKSAKQLIFELQDKYAKITSNKKEQKNKKENLHIVSEIIPTLKTLGFNKKQINSSIHLVKPNKDIEVMVEEAIKLISNGNQKVA